MVPQRYEQILAVHDVLCTPITYAINQRFNQFLCSASDDCSTASTLPRGEAVNDVVMLPAVEEVLSHVREQLKLFFPTVPPTRLAGCACVRVLVVVLTHAVTRNRVPVFHVAHRILHVWCRHSTTLSLYHVVLSLSNIASEPAFGSSLPLALRGKRSPHV